MDSINEICTEVPGSQGMKYLQPIRKDDKHSRSHRQTAASQEGCEILPEHFLLFRTHFLTRGQGNVKALYLLPN